MEKFRFEEEENPGVPLVIILDVEGEVDRHSGVHTFLQVIAHPDSSSCEEEDSMALNKGNKSLRELMASRGKVSTSQEAAKFQVPTELPPPPPPQIPTDLGLKPIPDLKKKRPVEVLEEGEVGPQKGTKQQKVAKDARDIRSQFVDSREEQNRADMRMTQRKWSPRQEVDKTPILWNASVREFQRGPAGYIFEALDQPLLLPKDMEAYRRFKQKQLFLSLKRDLAMVSNLHTHELRCLIILSFFLYFLTYYFFVVFRQIAQQVYVAEEWVRDARKEAEAKAEALSHADVERSLGALKQEQAEMAKKFKAVDQARLSVEAGLKTVERQAEDQRQKLHLTEIDLATEKQLDLDLKVELQKAKEAA